LCPRQWHPIHIRC